MLLGCRLPRHTNIRLGMVCSCQLSPDLDSKIPLDNRYMYSDAKGGCTFLQYTEFILSLQKQRSSQALQGIMCPRLSPRHSTNHLRNYLMYYSGPVPSSIDLVCKVYNRTQFYRQSLDCKSLQCSSFVQMIQFHSSLLMGRFHPLFHQLVLALWSLHNTGNQHRIYLWGPGHLAQHSSCLACSLCIDSPLKVL